MASRIGCEPSRDSQSVMHNCGVRGTTGTEQWGSQTFSDERLICDGCKTARHHRPSEGRFLKQKSLRARKTLGTTPSAREDGPTQPRGFPKCEFPLGAQPIFYVVAILPAARFVLTAGESSDLFVSGRRSTAGVLSRTTGAQVSSPAIVRISGIRSNDLSNLHHDSVTSLVFSLCSCLGGEKLQSCVQDAGYYGD